MPEFRPAAPGIRDACLQLVLHTSPNVAAKFEKAGDWQILTADYRWHFEVLPVSPSNFKSYSVKEV